MRRLSDMDDLYKSEKLLTKVKFYFSSKAVDEWSDPDEGTDSYPATNLNPITVKMYVTSISPEKMYFKQYGQHTDEGKIILCDEKYKKYFQNCNKIVIDGVEYSTYNKAIGSMATIAQRPHKQITVTIFRK